MSVQTKIYKTILRFDYKLSYKMIDCLGQFLELIESEVVSNFQNFNGNINVVEHSITATANKGDLFIRINMNAMAFDVIIEHCQGIELELLSRNTIFDICSKVLSELELFGTKKYTRIGVRLWFLHYSDDLKFKIVKELLLNNIPLFSNLKNGNKTYSKDDIALVYELSMDSLEFCRVNLGPYINTETNKYFSVKNEINEGVIVDIDFWQNKIAIPNLNVSELVKSYTKQCKYINEDILNFLKK